MRSTLTALVWIVSAVDITLGGLIASEFVVMATSLDPSQIATDGVETWGDTFEVLVAFAGLVAATMASLALWHTRRFKALGLILTAAEVGGVAWACLWVYRDYM